MKWHPFYSVYSTPTFRTFRSYSAPTTPYYLEEPGRWLARTESVGRVFVGQVLPAHASIDNLSTLIYKRVGRSPASLGNPDFLLPAFFFLFLFLLRRTLSDELSLLTLFLFSFLCPLSLLTLLAYHNYIHLKILGATYFLDGRR